MKKTKSIEYAFQALIKEYESVRESSISRDNNRRKIENYIILIIISAMAGLPLILDKQMYLMLLFISILINLISSAARHQLQLQIKLANYESILKKRLLELLSKIDTDRTLPKSIKDYWGWHDYLKKHSKKKFNLNFLYNIGDYLNFDYLYVFFSLALIVIYTILIDFSEISHFDFGILIIAWITFSWLNLPYIIKAFKQLFFSRVK